MSGKKLKNKNRYKRLGNNLLIKLHKKGGNFHTLSKEWANAMPLLASVYLELDKDFQPIDLVDLVVYERWLNG